MQEAEPQPRQENEERAARRGGRDGQTSLLQLRAAVTELPEASALHRCAGRKTVLYKYFLIYVLSSPVIVCCLIKKLIIWFYI